MILSLPTLKSPPTRTAASGCASGRLFMGPYSSLSGVGLWRDVDSGDNYGRELSWQIKRSAAYQEVFYIRCAKALDFILTGSRAPVVDYEEAHPSPFGLAWGCHRPIIWCIIQYTHAHTRIHTLSGSAITNLSIFTSRHSYGTLLLYLCVLSEQCSSHPWFIYHCLFTGLQ